MQAMQSIAHKNGCPRSLAFGDLGEHSIRLNADYTSQRVNRNSLLSLHDLVVVFKPKVGDQLFAHDVAQCVFELHGLDEQIVLRVEALGGLR